MKNEHFLYLLFAFNQGSKATKAAFCSGDFYQCGIENHVECWVEFVNNNEEYIID